MRRGLAILLLLLLVTACATTPSPPTYEGGATSCVPYARARSGIALSGDAWEWWEAAANRYDRSRAPRVGSVLVLQRTSRLRSGHLAVVARLVSAREIRVDHANWATGRDRGQVARDQPVQDVSPAGDWSLLRVWYPRTNSWGTTNFPAYGFIHPATGFAAR